MLLYISSVPGRRCPCCYDTWLGRDGHHRATSSRSPSLSSTISTPRSIRFSWCAQHRGYGDSSQHREHSLWHWQCRFLTFSSTIWCRSRAVPSLPEQSPKLMDRWLPCHCPNKERAELARLFDHFGWWHSAERSIRSSRECQSDSLDHFSSSDFQYRFHFVRRSR